MTPEKVGRPGGEAGFTLLELLIAVSIMTLVVGAISAGVIIAVHNQNGVAGEVSDSANAQATSAIYARDVQSAASVTTDAAVASCGPLAPGTTFLLGLLWSGGVGGNIVVSYVVNPTTGILQRLYCPGGSTSSTDTVTVTRGLSNLGVQVVVSPPSIATRAAAGWTSAAYVASVTLSALESSTAFHFDLLAEPRLSTPQSLNVSPGGNPAPPPLFLLGDGQSPLLGCGGNGVLDVNGSAFLDSPADGSAQLSGHPAVSATHWYTNDPNTSGTFTGGTVSPPPTYLANRGDPYHNLTPPSTAGLPVYSDGTYHGPGYYTTKPLTLMSGTTTLATGTYILGDGITVAGNATVTSGAGGVLLYVTGGQISMTGNANVSLAPLGGPETTLNESGVTVNTTPQTLTINPITISQWPPSGSASLGTSSGSLVTITYTSVTATSLGGVTVASGTDAIPNGATIQLPGPYAPVAPTLGIWQAASDTSQVLIGGNGIGDVISGTIYAPDAEVGGAGNGNFTAGSVVAGSIACDGNGTETIG